jgi:DNA/RNA endonuclease YhcR with UshA esterase domain
MKYPPRSMSPFALLLSGLALATVTGCQTIGPKIISASDDAAIQDALPKDFTVVGTVSGIDDGDEVIAIHFAGTEKSGFYSVVLSRGRDDVEKVYGPGLKTLLGKDIRVTGKITLYRDKPEIIISKPEQIEVLGDVAPA